MSGRSKAAFGVGSKIPKSARGVAYDLLLSVATQDSYANLLLPKLINEANLDTRDAGFATEMAFGSIRNQIFYHAIAAKCSGRDVSEIDIDVLTLIQLGAHQLLGMRVPSHAALSETVELAKKVLRPSLIGFVNGVLRRVSEKTRDEWLQILLKGVSSQVEEFSIRYSHPEWVVRALLDSLRLDGREGELEQLLIVNNQAPLVNLVALPGLSSIDTLLDIGAAIDGVSPLGGVLPDGDPANIQEIRQGLVRVQDQGSQLAAISLARAEVLSGSGKGQGAVEQKQRLPEEWLDLCAGPGGKAALLAAFAKLDGAEMVCNELQPHRAKLVEQALQPVNPNVYVRVGDGRDLGGDAPESFDRILLDAPCTGLGALRRRPESRFRKQQSDVAELAKLQRELFSSAWAGLKTGGVLAYVTCSPHPAETTAIVDWAEKTFGSNLELLDATKLLQEINPELASNPHRSITPGRKTVQLWPQRQETDAMFIALVRKTAN